MPTLIMNNVTETELDMFRDGIHARDLGIIGAFQYALSFMGSTKVAVYRRRADEYRTYGGWRYECASNHPARLAHRDDMPDVQELALRVEEAAPLPI